MSENKVDQMAFRPLTDEQLTEMERRLVAAENDIATQQFRRVIENTPAICDFQFQSISFVRRLLDDVKWLRKINERYRTEWEKEVAANKIDFNAQPGSLPRHPTEGSV